MSTISIGSVDDNEVGRTPELADVITSYADELGETAARQLVRTIDNVFMAADDAGVIVDTARLETLVTRGGEGAELLLRNKGIDALDLCRAVEQAVAGAQVTAGVYEIVGLTNGVSETVYYGETTDFARRRNEHLQDPRFNV